jgi:two-component system, NarL family, response regulator NreC
MNILLIDDHRLMREGLRAIIEREPGMRIVGEADTGAQAIDLAASLRPHVVVMDVAMPDLNGFEATRRIHHADPGIKVLALSMHSDRHYVAQMLEAGANGYLRKSAAGDELIRAIRIVCSGGTYLSPALATTMLEHFMQRPDKSPQPDINVLSTREREVLQLLAEGHSSKEIAVKLHRAVKTVESHRRQIADKLNLHGVAEMTKFAVRHGLTDLEEP